MIKKIIHRIWNERRQNVWLFIELMVASFFLWLAIDPLITLVYLRNLPKGYEIERVYRVDLDAYDTDHPRYNEKYKDAAATELYRQAMTVIKDIPEIKSWGVVNGIFEPNNRSYYIARLSCDSTKSPEGKHTIDYVGCYNFYPEDGSDLFATMGIRDAITGKILAQAEKPTTNDMYISRSVALKLFGNVNAIGRKITFENAGFRKHKDKEYNIIGIFEDMQMLNYDEHRPLILTNDPANGIGHKYGLDKNIIFRLKEEVDEAEFIKRFNNEEISRFAHGNYHCKGITSYSEISRLYDEEHGITNKYRLYTGLSGFAIFCTFMGVFSAFWIRTNNRQGDIGIMRSMGATTGNVIRQFTAEALILVTIAFIVAMPLIMHYYKVEGFAEPLAKVPTRMITETSDTGPDQSYLRNCAVPHFTIVSIISYLIIAAIAVAG